MADILAHVPNAELTLLTADPAGVRALTQTVLETHDRLDVLINNAATAAFRPEQVERMFATNVLAPFLLTNLLLPLLKRSAPARVVVVGSSAHRQVRTRRPRACGDSSGVPASPFDTRMARWRT